MENRNWFVHVEFVAVLISLLGGFYLLDSKMENQMARMDNRMLSQEQRTDRLYEMFIDLLKEKK